MRRLPSGSGCRRRLAAVLLVAVVGIAAPQLSGAGARWHHTDSPYRAVFEVVSKPNHPKAGVFVAVPVCGLCAADGSQLWAFDQSGQKLLSHPGGRGARNCALLFVQPQARTKEIYVYFGSKVGAPVAQDVFLPSLLCNARTLPEGDAKNWKQVARLLKESEDIGTVLVDRIEQAYNPVDSRDSVLLVFDGYLRIPANGKYTYMIVTDDAGYLFIDDKLVLSRDGRHWAKDAARGECRVEVTLTGGLHKVRLVLVDFGGGLMAVLGQWIDGQNKHVVPAKDFLQPGRTRLAGLESHYRDKPLPAFESKELSYMDYGGAQYTEVEVATHDGEEATFLFRDGLAAKGKSVRRILCGNRSMPVRVTEKRVTAEGLVPLSEVPPQARSLRDATDLKHYTALILSANLGDLDASTLKSYINLLNYQELNEDAIPLYEALASCRGVSADDRYAALMGLARASTKDFPDKSGKAFSKALEMVSGKSEWGQTAREYVEFLLYRQKDFAAAEKLLTRMLRGAPKDKRPMLRGLQLDLEVLQGKTEEAKEVLDELLGTRELGASQRFAAVKSNALRQRFEDLMKAGFLLDARKVLHEWADIAPIDRTHGTLPLARARYWERLGWLDGALAELDGAILMDPLLPNLPEVELRRGMILQQAGQKEKANEVFLRIAKEYPNHPAAQTAKERIQ